MNHPTETNAVAGSGQGIGALSGYRRGTVLGLTVAEVFILLLFLLMLAFLVLAQEWRAQQEAVEESLGELSEVLLRFEEDPETWAEALDEFEAPEEILTLRMQRDESERRLESLREALEEAGRRREEAEGEMERSREAARQAAEARDRAQERADEFARELLVRQKGHNPPCWYEVVPDGSGGEREKAHYLFNVAIFDDSMVFRRLEPPPGAAEDDNGAPYAEEARRLPLDRIPFDTPLDDAEVRRHFTPIHDAGKRAEVRSYSCVFSVRVWDEVSSNSSGAKERWQQAHDRVLEGLFGTFTGTNEPWDGPP